MGKAKMAPERKRSRLVGGRFTPDEDRKISDHAASLDLSVSNFVREAVLAALSKGPRVARKAKKAGSQAWMFDRLKDELAHWRDTGCEGPFVAFKNRKPYVREICNGTSLRDHEANLALDQFLEKWEGKIDRLMKKTRLRECGRIDPHEFDDPAPDSGTYEAENDDEDV